MSMVFHEVSGYAECDGNERGKRRRGGDPATLWWFNLRRGLFCVIVQKPHVQEFLKKSAHDQKIGDIGTRDLKRVSEMIRTIHDNNIHPQIIVWISSIPAAHHVQTRNVTLDSVGFSTSTSSPSERAS